jgi:DNA relaxase NicK
MKVHDSGIDYLTFTVGIDSPYYDEVSAYIWQEIGEMDAQGFKAKAATWQAYKGLRAGSIFAGERPDGFCADISGSICKQIAAQIKEKGWRIRCSRIDFQVTVRASKREAAKLNRLGTLFKRLEARKSENFQADISQHARAGGGFSVYRGGAGSRTRLVIYDKSAEQAGRIGPDLWRWELRYRKENARPAWECYRSAVSGQWLALSFVQSYCIEHNIPCEWVKDRHPQQLPSEKRVPDFERSMRALKRQYGKTVEKAVEKRRIQEVIDNLGLSEHVIVVDL